MIDVHHATSERGLVAPSSVPISLSFAVSDNLSRLLIGRFDEDGNPVPDVARRGDEGRLLLNVRSLDGGRVFDAPMGGHRLARPDRAGLARRVVAKGEDEIHRRGAGDGEFLPVLRPQAVGRILQPFQHLYGERIDGALGVASRRKGGEAARADLAQDRFGEDRAAAVAGAQEQHVEDALSHERPPWVGDKG